MNTEELTQIVTVHQQAIAQALTGQFARHDQEMSDIRAILADVARQQAANAHQLTRIDSQQEANTQQIARLTENLLQLGNFIADDIRRRQP